MSKIKLVNGDSLELIKKMPDNSVDLILTDPPYNIAKYSTGNIKFNWREDINNDLAKWDLKELKPSDLIDEYKRVLKPTGNIFIFTSYNTIGKFHEAFDDKFNTFQFMVWHKTNPVPNFFKKGFCNSCELIVACWDKGHTWNFKTQKEMHNFIESGICMGKERLKGEDGKTLHPTQKPVKILKHLIEISTNEGDIVFDPFMGVGSTGEACKELNRQFIGIELEKKYFEATQNRLGIKKKIVIFEEIEEKLINKVSAIRSITIQNICNLNINLNISI